MPRFLSDEWLAAVAEAALEVHVPEDMVLTVQHVVTETPAGEVRYAVRLTDGKAEVVTGTVSDADVIFTQSWETAVAVHRGELSAQDAFMTGRMRVDGDVRAVIREGDRLAALDGMFSTVRADTTY